MNYLFLIDRHPPTTSANGICAERIMSELVKRGNTVHCVCYNADEVTGTSYQCHAIPQKLWDRLAQRYAKSQFLFHKGIFIFLRILYWIYRFCILSHWPMNSFCTARNFYKKASEIIENEEITHLVAISYPGETLWTAKNLKNKYGKRIRAYLFPLDVTTEGKYDGTKLERFFSRIGGRRFLRSCTRKADRLLVLENAEGYFRKVFSAEDQEKFAVCGIPLLEARDEQIPDKSFRRTIECVYAGNLIYGIRNPIPLMDELEKCKIPEVDHINFHLFGKADQAIRSIWEGRYEYVRIIDHGWVDEDKLAEGIRDADVLINIGNTLCHLIPSKLFKYMSSNKPIIHQYFVEDDPCILYLKEYGNAFLFDQSTSNNSISIDLGLCEFLAEAEQKDIDLLSLFPRCTANYIADILES